MGKEEENHLKDMVFRGAFLVILVYVLVFLYNSGLLDKLRRPRAVKKEAVTERVVPAVGEEPSQSSLSNEVNDNDDVIE